VYLLDTDVVSDAIFLSAGTLGELQAGVELTRRQDPGKAQAIEAWLDLVAQSDNILPMNGRTFRQGTTLLHGRSDTLIEDAMIAATAILHGVTVVTRNVRDFRVFGVAVLDPFATRS
jgi:toxin FitB